MADGRFRRHPRPDVEVVEILERALDSARKGYVQTVTLVVVNALHHVETATAGDLSDVRANVLLGGLSRAAAEVIKHGG
jgi:hypothetical protein